MAIIAAGSVTVAALTSGDDKPASAPAGAEVSPTPVDSSSPTAPAEVSPTATTPAAGPSSVSPSALAPVQHAPSPAAGATKPSGKTKENTVQQPKQVAPAPADGTQPPAQTTQQPTTGGVGQNPGGGGTVDNGAPPKPGPADTNAPTGNPYPQQH
ncbi:hypothetical protein [Kitasatospora sp. NPDC058046]|uniref:hypothetical protein n=1 Tax=Kitasatospora sp. NPDC058046 TaxID=3346312 RepID=UPI0036DBB2C4